MDEIVRARVQSSCHALYILLKYCTRPRRMAAYTVPIHSEDRAQEEFEIRFAVSVDELKAKYDIELNKSHCMVDGDSAQYKTLVKNLYSRHKNEIEGPFSKVLVINIHNEGEPDSDYERERNG